MFPMTIDTIQKSAPKMRPGNSILITIDHGVTWCEEENYYVDWCCHPPPSQPPKTLQPFSFPSPFITLPPTSITSSFSPLFSSSEKKFYLCCHPPPPQPPKNVHQRLPPFFSLSPFISLDLHHMTGLFMHQPIYFSSPPIYSSENRNKMG